MAEYYCDHGAYGLTTNRIGLDVPTWGMPQDGDGTSKDAAVSVAIASITFSTVPSSGTFSVCGASVSTTGVTGAANVDTAANTLATNINATTNTVVTTVSPKAAQLRNFVYARGPASGAPAGTCQIMMRIGSASLNNAQNANAAIASTFNGSSTITQFAGGSGGCWGWFTNPIALGVSSSINMFNYGIFLTIPYAGTTPTKNDVVWVRTGGGASKLISIAVTSGNQSYPHDAFGTHYKFDTNTKWTGDTPTGELRLYISSSNWGSGYTIRTVESAYSSVYEALRRGGFVIEFYGATSTSLSLSPISGSAVFTEYWINTKFVDSGTAVGSDRAVFNPFGYSLANGTIFRRYRNCDYVVTTPRTTIWQKLFGSMYNATGYVSFRGCTFNLNISGVADPGDIGTLEQISPTIIEVVDCAFLGREDGFKLFPNASNWSTNSTPITILLENNSGLQILNTYTGFNTSSFMQSPERHLIIQDNRLSTTSKGYRYENTRGVVEWLPNATPAFPTLSATLYGTGEAYSLKAVWAQSPGINTSAPFELPPIKAFNTLSTATRTVSLEMFLPDVVSSGIAVQFSYIDSTGIPRSQTVTSLINGSTAWNNKELYSGFSAKKASIDTEYQVQANTEITCRVYLMESPPEAVTNVYINPEIGIV